MTVVMKTNLVLNIAIIRKANLVRSIAMVKNANLDILIGKNSLSLSLPSNGFIGLAVPQCL